MAIRNNVITTTACFDGSVVIFDGQLKITIPRELTWAIGKELCQNHAAWEATHGENKS